MKNKSNVMLVFLPLLSSAYSGLCTSNKLKFLLGSNLTKDLRAIAPEYDKTKIIIVVTTVIIAISSSLSS
jgi:ABC-type branched-subunit amino acid transport system substrate-binding protein